ncbi:HIT-like protein [Scleroderma citrinum]
MSDLTILTVLRSYAQMNPERLPASILFNHTETCLTVFDAFPKAIFHFLVLPRIKPPLGVDDLTDLRTLLKCNKKKAGAVLKELSDEADNVKKMIQEEMLSRYGFQWEIWTGFHPVPSMQHLHLHIISSDLCSGKLKNKKHYNSFHPKLGFFLHLSDVLSWFEADPSFFEMRAQLKPRDYQPLLKEELACFKCGRAMKNMPTLKTHLQVEWDDEARKEKARIARKRKREESQSCQSSSSQADANKGEGRSAKRSPEISDDRATNI